MSKGKQLDTDVNRRRILRAAGALGATTFVGGHSLAALADHLTGLETITLPFINGERPLGQFPEKRKLIVLTSRPPQLETPFSVFNEGAITPNDAFFVRYHNANIFGNPPNGPQTIDANTFRLTVGGNVQLPLSLSITDLKTQFTPIEITAVCQCAGNSRGFFQPRVRGGQWGNGGMGNARWTGVPLRDVLNKAGVGATAVQVTFSGLDQPVLGSVPNFAKALDVSLAMNGEVMLAYAMNGADLPMLNGFPLRLVVPGYYATYWVKHLNQITVIDSVYDNFYMTTAYRIPNNDCACVPPGTTPSSTVPINRMNVRSFITSLQDGARLPMLPQLVKGIAFDGGTGILFVLFSDDEGVTWREARLGPDLGKYSFRQWEIDFLPQRTGPFVLKTLAVSGACQVQPFETRWNPPGYMRNNVESLRISVVA